MARKNRHNVLIAGAGPAGLAAALFLQQRGVEVEVVDERWDPPDEEFSVLLHRDTLERLDDAGVRLDLAREGRAIDSIVIHDRGRRHVSLGLGDAPGERGPVEAVPLRAVRDALEDALRAHKIKVHWHRRLARIDATADRVLAEIEVIDRDSAGYGISLMKGSVIRVIRQQPTHLIAADGRDSVVRTQLRIGWRQVAPPSIVAAFEAESTWDPGRELHLYVGDGTAALWATAGGRVRLTFELPEATPMPASWKGPGEAPDRTELMALLGAQLPWLELPVGKLAWSYAQRVEHAVAERSSLGPAWLLGEAAHQLSPLASPTLNHSIAMAHDLAVVIDEVARGQGGGELLAHQAARSDDLTLRMARPGDLFAPSADTEPFIAASYRRILPMLPARGRELDELARQLGLTPPVL